MTRSISARVACDKGVHPGIFGKLAFQVVKVVKVVKGW
jgi:hypothetical protein